MARRWFRAEKLRMPVHSAPLRSSATCWLHDHSSGSDLRSQYAIACLPFRLRARRSRIWTTVADLAGFVDEAESGRSVAVPSPPGMHTLLFLDPGHFHAALTLRVPQARAADDVFVYAREGRELKDFLTLVDRFNGRSADPTRWRPIVTTCDDPLARLVDERRGDVVVLAGKNGGKARTIRRLHDAGFHVLADKPWLVGPADLEHVRASLAGWPLAAEIMTGRHDLPARLVKKLVGAPAIFGAFRDDVPAIEQESVHHLEKLVDGAPL